MNHIEAETRFLNVDLDVTSKRDLAPFIAALAEKVIVLHTHSYRRKHEASLELAGSPGTAAEAINRFSKLLRRLPQPAQRVWNHATVRSFNVGIQGGLAPRSSEFTLNSAVIKTVAQLGAQLVFTVYQTELPSVARRNPFRRRREK